MPAIERWAPVFAKCSLLSRRGLKQLLDRQHPSSKNELPSVGETLRESLEAMNATERFCSSIQSGWAGWTQWKLSASEVKQLFTGKLEEAEQVADFLLKLAHATDPTNLYSLFLA